jgi:hypothetical protein
VIKRRMNWVRLVGAGLLLVAMAAAACGGDDDDVQDGGATADATTSTSSGNGETPASAATSGGPGGSASGCPFTEEEVSGVLGVDVEGDTSASTSCTFFPPNSSSPRAIFVRLPALACTEEYLEATGQEYEPYGELGVEAFATLNTSPASIIVCADNVFDINVEIPGNAAASLAAADELARLALDGG